MSVYILLVVAPQPERDTDIVGAEYIHERTGLSLRTISDGKGGVREIPRARRKPAGWFRRDVDLWLEKRARALRENHEQRQRGPRLVRRKPIANLA